MGKHKSASENLPRPGRKEVQHMKKVMQKADLTAPQEKFIRMEANGIPTPDIIQAVFGVATDAPEYHACECKLSRWRKLPQYEKIWKDEVRKLDFADYTAARRILRKSMNNDNDGWLAMQSAVNVMSSSSKRIYQDEDSAVTVRIEGMPDIGTPDGE